MTPDLWETVKDLFEEGSELEPSARSAWLASQDLPDEARAELARLLNLGDAAAGFLETPPAAVARLRRGDGRVFPDGAVVAGRYRIIRLLGRGGMGEVYEAGNQSGERIALKVLSPDF
ncbi:MAG TPA: hypothetical protein VGF59_13250, partial [Bryobacteraceae bacterium]